MSAADAATGGTSHDGPHGKSEVDDRSPGEVGHPVNRGEIMAFALLVFVGGYLAVSAVGLGLRTDGVWIGPGTMPLLVGVLLFAIAAGQLVARLIRARLQPGAARTEDGTPTTGSQIDIFGRSASQRIRQLRLVVGALAAAILFVPLLGFLLSFGALVLFVSTVVERRSLLVAALVTGISVAAVQLIFVEFLGVPLPAGLIGFGGS